MPLPKVRQHSGRSSQAPIKLWGSTLEI